MAFFLVEPVFAIRCCCTCVIYSFVFVHCGVLANFCSLSQKHVFFYLFQRCCNYMCSGCSYQLCCVIDSLRFISMISNLFHDFDSSYFYHFTNLKLSLDWSLLSEFCLLVLRTRTPFHCFSLLLFHLCIGLLLLFSILILKRNNFIHNFLFHCFDGLIFHIDEEKH